MQTMGREKRREYTVGHKQRESLLESNTQRTHPNPSRRSRAAQSGDAWPWPNKSVFLIIHRSFEPTQCHRAHELYTKSWSQTETDRFTTSTHSNSPQTIRPPGSEGTAINSVFCSTTSSNTFCMILYALCMSRLAPISLSLPHWTQSNQSHCKTNTECMG